MVPTYVIPFNIPFIIIKNGNPKPFSHTLYGISFACMKGMTINTYIAEICSPYHRYTGFNL